MAAAEADCNHYISPTAQFGASPPDMMQHQPEPHHQHEDQGAAPDQAIHLEPLIKMTELLSREGPPK